MSDSKATRLPGVVRHVRAIVAVSVCFAASVYAPAACFASVQIGRVVSTVEEGSSGALSSDILGILVRLVLEALQAG